MSTLRAPRGVTSIGGAKVYAAKLATADYDQMQDPCRTLKKPSPSPKTTVERTDTSRREEGRKSE